MLTKQLPIKILFGIATLLLAAEIIVRALGIIDVPIYATDPEIGYIPEPNQSGCFLRKRCWVFNDRSMGTATQWNPSLHKNILLIGNSVVMGGTPYDQSAKLGLLLQAKIGLNFSIWPIAAGGWSNLNEAAYFERNFDVAEHAQYFVWEFRSGGLGELSKWRGDYVFPKARPPWALWYVVRRCLLRRILPFNMDELPPHGSSTQGSLAKF